MAHYWVNQHLRTCDTNQWYTLFTASYVFEQADLFQKLGYDTVMQSPSDYILKQEDCSENIQHVLGE